MKKKELIGFLDLYVHVLYDSDIVEVAMDIKQISHAL